MTEQLQSGDLKIATGLDPDVIQSNQGDLDRLLRKVLQVWDYFNAKGMAGDFDDSVYGFFENLYGVPKMIDSEVFESWVWASEENACCFFEYWKEVCNG